MPSPDQAVPTISVAEFARRLRRAVDAVSGNEWIMGEVASAKISSSGHLYFVLKDEREDALIECVMYRGQTLRFRGLLVDGARVQIGGRATLWAPRGRLQFVAERARPAGRGALLEALERLKVRLTEEGLFAQERKRPLPQEPRIIGVVTSATGAAFWDIVAVAERRGPAYLLLAPAQVQGEGAVDQLVEAIDLLERHTRVDVMIVGRGGGAGEDLMAFNDERLVRRLARARVPTVSAVGHDVDFTLTDLVADHRAATPSQAAELVVGDHATRCDAVRRAAHLLVSALRKRLEEDRGTADTLRYKLRDPRFLVLQRQQQLDDLRADMQRRILGRLRTCRPAVDRLSRQVALHNPRLVLTRQRGAYAVQERLLIGKTQARLGAARARLSELTARLEGLSPVAVLGRGYAIATRLDGRVIRGPADIGTEEPFRLRLGQGELLAIAREKMGGKRNAVDADSPGIDHGE